MSSLTTLIPSLSDFPCPVLTRPKKLGSVIIQDSSNLSDFQIMFYLFSLGIPLKSPTISKEFKPLLSSNFCYFQNNTLIPNILITPLSLHSKNYIFITDFPAHYSLCENPVMYISPDSICLSKILPSLGSGNRVLDCYAGSGIQGIISASFGNVVTCLDINPRSKDFTMFNAALNNVKVEFILEDVKTIVKKTSQYNLVLANPPFVPTWNPFQPLYTSGGSSGTVYYDIILKYIRENNLKGAVVSEIMNLGEVEEGEVLWLNERILSQVEYCGIRGEKEVDECLQCLDYNNINNVTCGLHVIGLGGEGERLVFEKKNMGGLWSYRRDLRDICDVIESRIDD